MKLVVAEKPSVARDLASVLGVTKRGQGSLSGNGWVITWCIGHLVELDEPEAYDPAWKRWSFATLPMLPSTFRLRPAKNTLKQWRIVRDLLRRKDFTGVVNACDAGREGELIFRYVYERAKCKLAVERLWISSLTSASIRAGFEQLHPGSRYDGLAAAARCRSRADWLVGLNATRAMTLVSPHGSVYSIGRVQTPTLALLVEREKAIEQFESKPFWELSARVDEKPSALLPEGASMLAKWRAPTGEARLAKDGLARALQDRVRSTSPDAARATLVVARVERKETRERPPQLFDLTSLQRTANVRFGFSADRTLKGLQALYERHKAITYPRTSSRYLTTDQRSTLPALVGRFSEHERYGEHAARLARDGLRVTSRIVDDKKVTDHHAIIVTGKIPNVSGDEAKLYDLVVRRFLAALHDDARFQATDVVLVASPDSRPAARKRPRSSDAILQALPDPPDQFFATGRVLTDPGWQRVEPPPRRQQRAMPDLQVGTRIPTELVITNGSTQPPPRYTEATLLGAMETAGRLVDDEALREAMKSCGLGTPATRASTIETLIRRDYVTRKQKLLVPTEKGVELIDQLPVPTLRSAELTGAWEARLQQIAQDETSTDAFMRDVHALVKKAVSALRERGAQPVARRRIGACPRCNADVLEERAAFACRACHFRVGRRMASREITTSEVEVLLSRGRTGILTGFRSKKKRRFRAALVVADGEVTFSFPGKKASAPPPKPAVDSGLDKLVCPRCQHEGLVRGKRAWGCAAWRSGCQFVVPYVIDTKKLTPNELRDLIVKGRTRKATFATGKGRVHLENGSPKLVLDT